MRLVSTLRGWIYLRLIRLYYFLQVHAARKAVLTKRLCCILIDAEIRILQPNLLQLGEDDDLDLLVEFVARQLTARELLPELGSVAGDPRAGELLELARKSDTVCHVIARYHSVDAFFAGLVKEDARKIKQLELAQLANPKLPEYDATAVYRELTKTVARLKKLRNELAERSAFKIEFSIKAISGGVALISAIFVVAGFLYVRYFYQRMGIDVSLYFSVGDYLAASVEQIRAGAFAAAIALVTFGFGVRAQSLRSRLNIRASTTTRRHQDWAIGLFTMVICCLSAYSIYIGKPDFINLHVSFLVLSYWVADFIAGAFFKNRLAAMSAMVGALVFSTNVGISVYERSERLLTGLGDTTFKQTILFKDAAPAVNGELFGANGSYFFIYFRDKGVTHVVPRDRVVQIDIMKLMR
jgi:hypothetical protein